MRPASATPAALHRASFGTLPDGRPVDTFTLVNARGTELRVMTYGGIILSLRVPDRHGRLDDVVLGFDELAGYVERSPYFGAIVGRVANRIARGRFMLDGTEHRLATNDGPNHLHGGVRGFDKVVWDAEPFREEATAGLTLRHTSAAGDEGYPGTLRARVHYSLTDRDDVIIDYHAVTDAPTPVNLSQHTYFDLAAGGADILGHELAIGALYVTPTDATLIPTGALAPVQGTPFDFRAPIRIGTHIAAHDEQLRFAGGYDHNFVLARAGRGLAHAARLSDPTSGRVLDVHTTEPGLQFYSGNFLDGSLTGKGGRVYGHRAGLCLETQHYPDSVNHRHFPSIILRPGEEYRSQTVWSFGTMP